MGTRHFWFLALPALLFSLGAVPGAAQQADDNAKDKAALAKNIEGFVAAFEKGDAKAVAAFWTTDGDYTDQSGNVLKGREAIEKAFKGLFEDNKGLKLRVKSDSLSFVTPDVAIEDGTTEVIPPDDAPPTRARYTNVHVKKNGQWLLRSVRDAVYAPPTNYQHLCGLEWVVGDWAQESDKGVVERLSFGWSQNQNFITASFTTTVKNISVGSVTFWIGWDPVAKRIRSWSFDANGGFGEGSWTQDGKKWIIKTTSLHADGKKAATTFVLTPVDANTLTWQARDRTLDGKEVPDTKEVKLKRVK